MSLTSTSAGNTNLEADPAVASGGTVTAARWKAGLPVNIVSISCGPISTASGAQCGHVTLRDGTTVLWRAYVFFTATAAAQSSVQTFELNALYTPATSLNLLYTAVTDATTANCNLIWR